MATFKTKFREYFLLLLPVFFVLHGYTENYPLIKSKDVFQLLIAYLLVFGGLTGLFLLLFKSWRKAAVFVLLLMCFHFFFGNVHNSMKSLLHDNFLTKYIFILPFSAIFFVATIIYLRKSKKEFTRLVLYSNALLIILIAVDAFQLIIKMERSAKPSANSNQNIFNCNQCEKPDIYFIVADEYAGQKELKDIFQFDNSAFENELRQRGFFVNDSSICVIKFA